MTRPPNTYHEAMELLDLRRKGAEVPEAHVLIALELTGDYVPPSRYTAPQFRQLFGPARA